MRWILPLLCLGCGQTEEKTSEPAEPVELKDSAIAAIPEMTVTHPERGDFFRTGSGEVRGFVDAGSAPLGAVEVNGKTVSLNEDGEFVAPIAWDSGIHIIGLRVEDEGGERAVDGRAIYAGPMHEPGAWLEGAMRMEIDAQILDDDDPDPDDFAGLIELVLGDNQLTDSFLGTTIETESMLFTPTALDYDDIDVDLVPGDGILYADVQVSDLDVDFALEGVSWYSWGSTTGTATAVSATLMTRMTVESAGGTVRAETTEILVDIEELTIDVAWVPSWLEGLVDGWTERSIEDVMKETVTDLLAEQVANALSAFTVEGQVSETVQIQMRLSGVDVTEDGVRFVADAALEGTDGIELPRNAGSLDTPGDPPEWPLNPNSHFGAAVDDDLVNQLAFAVWHAGLMEELSFDAVTLGGLSGSPIPAPLGPAEAVVLGLDLPPVIQPPSEDGWDAQISLGEWRMRFDREDGEVLEFSVNVSSQVMLEIDEYNEVELHLDNRPAEMKLEIGVIAAPDSYDPGDLAALVRLLVPPLMGNATDFAPTIPIPELRLDAVVDVPSTQGLAFYLDGPALNFTESGWIEMAADLGVQSVPDAAEAP